MGNSPAVGSDPRSDEALVGTLGIKKGLNSPLTKSGLVDSV